MPRTTALVAVGAARHLPHDVAIDPGPWHPAGHPGLQIAIEVEDEIIVAADVRIGLMHRSAEKLFEHRDYRQALALANRHDWLCAFASELGLAMAIEEALGIRPPDRATWSRTLLAELNRITASLVFIGAFASPEALAMRERLVHLQEVATGGRVHPMITRIGGLAGPLETAWLDDLAIALDELMSRLPVVRADLDAMADALSGVAVLTSEQALRAAALGPVGRASGVDTDLRRDAPSLAYGELAELITVPIDASGDIPARHRVLVEQLPVSRALIAACDAHLRDLGAGPVDVPLPKTIRLPEGMTTRSWEGPLGVAGILIASTGEKTPWRLKLRSPSFATLQAMEQALPGTPMRHLAAAVLSFPFVLGDADR